MGRLRPQMKKNAEETAKIFIDFLERNYPHAECSLRHENAFQLLVATILSAQCTDERVNIITEDLFEKYQSTESFMNADMDELMDDIRSCGFYKNKAKSIKGAAEMIVTRHGGSVPGTLDELTKIPGVGRKTANVVLGNVFAKPAITVDTHVKRISTRLGLTDETEPDKIEQDLQTLIPYDIRTDWSHRTIHFGRDICTAKKPSCSECGMSGRCLYYSEKYGG